MWKKLQTQPTYKRFVDTLDIFLRSLECELRNIKDIEIDDNIRDYLEKIRRELIELRNDIYAEKAIYKTDLDSRYIEKILSCIEEIILKAI
jgi:heme oxygenase